MKENVKENIDKIHVKTKTLKELIFDPTVRLLPGQIAFFLILSIFPLLMLVGYVASFFDISIVSLLSALEDALPTEVFNVISDVISGKSFDNTIGISILVGFILASNGAHAIVLASNALYGFPSDDFVKRRVKSMIMIIILVFLFVFVMLVLAYGNIIAKIIMEWFGVTNASQTIYKIFVIAKWPIAIIMIFLSIKLIYVIAPDWHILSKNTTKGAMFTTIGWTVATAVFSYYITHFANYDIFYGSLSSIVIFMIWIYFLSYILVVGIAINVKQYKDKEDQ